LLKHSVFWATHKLEKLQPLPKRPLNWRQVLVRLVWLVRQRKARARIAAQMRPQPQPRAHKLAAMQAQTYW
jgi:hypothetical protein